MLRSNVDLSDTIFALVSGSLPCAVGVVRLSGKKSFPIAQEIFTKRNGSHIERRKDIVFGFLSDKKGQKIDDILLLSFVSPHSFTGEDVIEFHCHGTVPVIQALSDLLSKHGARHAEKGEFSYRAFLNDKMSASDLENLGDLFLAQDKGDLEQIYARKDGSMNHFVGILREYLIEFQAIIDTAVDFSEDTENVILSAKQPLTKVIHECSLAIHRYSSFKQGGKEPRLVLAGRPNAGKSSVFNALLGRYRVIVHKEPGTTRDVVEEDIEVGGKKWKIVDTAGVRKATDKTEFQGLLLGSDYLGASSFWILVIDGVDRMSSEERTLLQKFGQKPHVIVWNKMDLPQWKSPENIPNKNRVICVSAKTGDGISELWNYLREEMVAGQVHSTPLPSEVQAARLRVVMESLKELQKDLESEAPPELMAEKNRQVLNKLESVVGEVKLDDVLDRVFTKFCIGK